MTPFRPLSARIAALAFGLAAFGAVAAPSVTITGVGTRDGTGALQMSTGNLDLGSNRALLITGYLADLGAKDVGRSGSVVLESTADQSKWTIPIVSRLWGARYALQAVASGKLDPAVAQSLNDAGFLAAADAYSIPPGTYTVKSVAAIFGMASVVTVPVTETMTVTIPETRVTTSLALTDAQGATVAFTPKAVPSSGDIRLSQYPALRSGTFTLTTPAYDRWGVAAAQTTALTLNYQRPLVKIDVSNPAAEGFEGFPQQFGLVNPLTNSTMTGAISGVASIDPASGAASALLNGVTLAPGGTANVALDETPSAKAGTGSIYAARAAAAGEGGKINLFINAPDAPDLQFTVGNWDPDKAIAVAASKPSFAVGVEVANVSAGRVSGTRCGSIFDGNATVLALSGTNILCAVRWVQKPPGLNNVGNSGALTGRFATLGTFSGDYETGVLWMHPVSKQIQFSRAGSHSISVQTVLPKAPTIGFLPDTSLYKPGAPNPLTYAGTALAGGVQVSSPYPGMTVKITPDIGAVVNGNTNSTYYFKPTFFENSTVGNARTLRVEANYPAAPDVIYTKDFTFDVVPRKQMLVLSNPLTPVSTAATKMDAKFGAMVSATAFAFDPDTQGRWSLQLTKISGNTFTPVGSPITNIPADGALSFDLGFLTPGLHTFTVVATQTDAPTGVVNKVNGRNVAVQVRNGAAIPVYSVVKPTDNGPSPFTATFGVLPVDRARVIDVGDVRYDVSSDGITFTPFTKADGTPMAGPMMLFAADTLTGDKTQYMRATVKNRWSGLETVGDVQQLQSFLIPDLAITSPRYTFVGHPITVNAVVAGDPGSVDLKWTVKYTQYDPAPVVTAGGTSLTVTPTKAVNPLVIELAGTQVGAPDNYRAARRATVSVVVLNPVLQAPSVSGPTIIESGKSFTWSGVQRNPFPPGTITDLVINSRWVLPDGSNSTANPVTYQYKEGDANTVRFESWIEGFPSSLVGTDFRLSPWTYQFPAMKVVATVLSPYTPARVQFNAGLANPALLASLRGEPLTYTWTLPSGATLVSQNAGVMTADFPNAGTYTGRVTVEDTRGNTTTVDSQSFNVLPPKPLTFTLSLGSGDRFNRPPGPIVARVTPTSVPVGDSVHGVFFYIDGVQRGTEVLNGANFAVTDPGTYTVKAVMNTVKGITAEATQTITFATGDLPNCTALQKNGDGVNVLWFAATCKVQRGYVNQYRWKVNGQATSVTSTTFQQQKAYISSTDTVEVTATTDFGQSGGAIYDVHSGTQQKTP